MMLFSRCTVESPTLRLNEQLDRGTVKKFTRIPLLPNSKSYC